MKKLIRLWIELLSVLSILAALSMGAWALTDPFDIYSMFDNNAPTPGGTTSSAAAPAGTTVTPSPATTPSTPATITSPDYFDLTNNPPPSMPTINPGGVTSPTYSGNNGPGANVPTVGANGTAPATSPAN